MKKILKFETEVTYFLRKTSEILKKLNPLLPHDAKTDDLLEQLEELVNNFYEVLPEYCGNYINLLAYILMEENSIELRRNCIPSAIEVARVLRQKPSFEVFRQLTLWKYENLREDTRFSKEYLEDFVKEAWKRQTRYENALKRSESMEEWKWYQERLEENDQVWIGIVQMSTANESILRKVIRYAHIGASLFQKFCVEMIYSDFVTDQVWLDLIHKIQKENMNQLPKKKMATTKTSIFCMLLSLRQPSLKVAYALLEEVVPVGMYYYDYYYLLAQYYFKEKDFMQKIQEKLKQEEKIEKNVNRYTRKRLKLLLQNPSF